MARTFPTTSDFINESSIGSVNVTGTAITIHCWIKTSQNGVIVNRYGSSGPTQQFFLQATGGKLQVAISDGASDVATGATTITDGAWHSVAMRKNGLGAGALEAWVDGAVDGSATSNRAAQSIGSSAGSRFVIGLRSTGATSFGGAIAEMAVWLVTLTAAEMVALQKGASPLKVRPASLYHYWPIWGLGTEIDLVNPSVTMAISGNPPLANHSPTGCPFPVAA